MDASGVKTTAWVVETSTLSAITWSGVCTTSRNT